MRESLRKIRKYAIPLLLLLMVSPVIYELFIKAWHIGVAATAGLLIVIVDLYGDID